MSIVIQYADTFGIDRKEVTDWVNAYIRRPGEFPRLIEAGLIEDTEAKRKESIKRYMEEALANSVTGRIRQDIQSEYREAA